MYVFCTNFCSENSKFPAFPANFRPKFEMSKTENPHGPSFFSLSRLGKKKTSPGFANLTNLSRSFDQNLNLRLKALFPGEIPSLNSKKSPAIVTLSWLSLAVDLLSNTHSDAKALFSQLPDSGNWTEFYLDESVKLLDFCNAISSEISRLQHGRLLINFVIHLLGCSGGSSPTPENLRKARNSLKDWHKGSPPVNVRAAKNTPIVFRDLTPSKPSPAEKLMYRTVYAVNAVTIFVASALMSAVYGSPDELAPIRISGDFLWADAFNDLESVVRGELKKRFVSGSKGKIGELDDVSSCVDAVSAIVDEASYIAGKEELEKLEGAVKELEKSSEKFSDGLEGLLLNVNGFFDVVLFTRNAMLENYGMPKKKI